MVFSIQNLASSIIITNLLLCPLKFYSSRSFLPYKMNLFNRENRSEEYKRPVKPIPNPPHNLYDFHQSPDGEDCMEKTYYYTKYAATIGAVFSTYEMLLNSKPSTIYGAIARFGRFTLPTAAMGVVFGTSLCLLGQIRKKTDITNHVLAGAAAGSVWGFKYGRISHGHQMAVLVAVLAGYFRYFTINNLPMIIDPPPESRMNYMKMDFSIKTYDDPGRPKDP